MGLGKHTAPGKNLEKNALACAMNIMDMHIMHIIRSLPADCDSYLDTELHLPTKYLIRFTFTATKTLFSYFITSMEITVNQALHEKDLTLVSALICQMCQDYKHRMG